MEKDIQIVIDNLFELSVYRRSQVALTAIRNIVDAADHSLTREEIEEIIRSAVATSRL